MKNIPLDTKETFQESRKKFNQLQGLSSSSPILA
jgi:hypothetical protein